MSDMYREAGATVEYLPLTTAFRGRDRFWRSKMVLRLAVGVFRMVRMIRAFEPEVVYTNTSSVLTGAIAARVTRTPHLWHIHENLATFPDPYIFSRASIGRIVERLSAQVICVSALAREALYPQGCSKAVVIHNGLSEDWTCEEDTKTERSPWDPVKPRVVGCVGGISYRRGLDVLLKALGLLGPKHADLRLEIWGEGDEHYARELQRLACSLGVAECVKFMGYSDQMVRVCRSCDVLVVPSRSESFSRPALEAMASGVPVIATRCGGPEEFIEDRVTGRLVSVDAPEELANALLWVLEDPDRAREMARRAKEKALRDFRLDDKLCEIRAALLRVAR